MTSILDQIYLGSPILFQQMMVAGYGWWWYQRRYNAHFSDICRRLKEQDTCRLDQFAAYQAAALRNLGKAASRSPYYSKVFQAAGVDGSELSFENLSKLPLLEKETLRNRARDLLTQNPPPKGTLIFKSSGTTGTPTEIYYTPEFHAWELALPAVRNLGWAGIQPTARRVMFGVRKVCRYDQDRPPFWRFSPAENMAYASIYHLSPQYLPEYMKFLRSYRPEMIMGYPSALGTLARYALDRGDFPATAKAIFTTSETVSDAVRANLEAAWKCKVYDRYGAVEGCMFASQCEYGRYHVSPEAGIIEILDPEGVPCPPGRIGEVICTGLQNTLQPLIRYRIGDVASWAEDQHCACGRNMPILERIEGRYEDMCVTRDGRQITRFDTVFKGIDCIREAQIVQETLDRFTVYVVPGEGYTEQVSAAIRHNMEFHVGQVETTVIPVDAIERTESGKFRAVICKVAREDKKYLQN